MAGMAGVGCAACPRAESERIAIDKEYVAGLRGRLTCMICLGDSIAQPAILKVASGIGCGFLSCESVAKKF